MAIIDANIAREIAEQNPELHQTRQTAFGTDYLKDIEQGTGTAQYYGGWGNKPGYGFTPAAEPEVAAETAAPIVTAPVAGDQGQGTVPIAAQPTTTDYLGEATEGTSTIGNLGQLATGDTPLDLSGSSQDLIQQGTIETPQEWYSRTYGDPAAASAPYGIGPNFPADYESLDNEERSLIDQEYTNAYGINTTPEGSLIDKAKSKISGGIETIKDLGSLAISPIGTIIKKGIDAIPESQSQIEYEGYNPTQQQTIDAAYGPGGVMEGYNVVSGMGEGVKATVEDRLDTINRTLADKSPEERVKSPLTDRKAELESLLETIDPQPETYTTGFEGSPETMVVTQDPIEKTYAEKADDVWQDIEVIRTPAGEVLVNTQTGEVSNNIEDLIEKDTTPVQEATGVAQDTTTGDASIAEQIAAQDRAESAPAYEDFSEPNVQADSGDVYAGSAYGYDEAAEKSDNGGDNGGGGKIVCTMMNETYGFGDFRNKIWLRQSKNLAPEYQKGYHILFLPLVKLSKKNKLLKKTLEHIAVHRTIDIRQEARGKVHILGRLYRKILEPLCYWVGKYAKR